LGAATQPHTRTFSPRPPRGVREYAPPRSRLCLLLEPRAPAAPRPRFRRLPGRCPRAHALSLAREPRAPSLFFSQRSARAVAVCLGGVLAHALSLARGLARPCCPLKTPEPLALCAAFSRVRMHAAGHPSPGRPLRDFTAQLEADPAEGIYRALQRALGAVRRPQRRPFFFLRRTKFVF
jgi:hypothetical protein